MEQHGHADTDGEPADSGDQWLPVMGKDLEEIGSVDAQPAAFRGFQELANIGAGRKDALTAGQHDTADGVAGLGIAERPRDRSVHRLRQRILLFRAVEPDDTHGAVIAD